MGSQYRAQVPVAENYRLNSRGVGTHQALLRLVRPRSRVLDVGCADGSFGAMLRVQRQAYVAGVEADPLAADLARKAIDEAIVGSIADPATLAALASQGPYDHIVLGDVLEHLVEPDVVLTALIPLLAPGGTALISLPNVVSLRARARLLAGVWRYEDLGIFDRTHLRFFSVASARALVTSAGLHIDREIPVGPLSHRLGMIGSRVTSLRPGLLATQVVFEASRSDPVNAPSG